MSDTKTESGAFIAPKSLPLKKERDDRERPETDAPAAPISRPEPGRKPLFGR